MSARISSTTTDSSDPLFISTGAFESSNSASVDSIHSDSIRSVLSPSLKRDSLIDQLVELNRSKPSWKQKLEVVDHLVSTNKNKPEFRSKGLALIAAYLYFIASGQIKCCEDG